MKIGIIASMQFTDNMIEMKNKLEQLGHVAFMTPLHTSLLDKNPEEIEAIKHINKTEKDAIRVFWNMMEGADAVLVLNYERYGIANYIGANTFLEIGFAHVLGQKVFLLNPLPDQPYIRPELEAIKPVIINGDLKLIQ